MSALDTLVQSTIKVVSTHREMKRAHADGANEAARKRYTKTLISALDALDRNLEAFLKSAPKSGTAPPPPFDWNGAARATIALAKLVVGSKGKSTKEVIDIIDAEVVKS